MVVRVIGRFLAVLLGVDVMGTFKHVENYTSMQNRVVCYIFLS